MCVCVKERKRKEMHVCIGSMCLWGGIGKQYDILTDFWMCLCVYASALASMYVSIFVHV